eukprot:5747253-Amphidinium_carterae.1
MRLFSHGRPQERTHKETVGLLVMLELALSFTCLCVSRHRHTIPKHVSKCLARDGVTHLRPHLGEEERCWKRAGLRMRAHFLWWGALALRSAGCDGAHGLSVEEASLQVNFTDYDCTRTPNALALVCASREGAETSPKL